MGCGEAFQVDKFSLALCIVKSTQTTENRACIGRTVVRLLILSIVLSFRDTTACENGKITKCPPKGSGHHKTNNSVDVMTPPTTEQTAYLEEGGGQLFLWSRTVSNAL